MKALSLSVVVAALALSGCSSDDGTPGNTAATDAGVAVDSGTQSAVDAGASTQMYPAGPYGSRVGALFEPLALAACNREGTEAAWRFDQSGFWDNQLTIMISAMWCIPLPE